MLKIASALLLSLIFLAGCEKSEFDSTYGKTTESTAPAQTTSATSSKSSSTSANTAGDAVPFGALRWSYGGINGSGAALSSPTIGGLRVSGSSLSYGWKGQNLSAWGLSSGDAGAYACLFVQKTDGSWVGGKFDWISSSRTSRNLENVLHGYEGWNLSGTDNPCPVAFVIVSSDLKRRTNVISSSWKR